MEQKDIDRFWSKVSIRDPDDCWEWQASSDPHGYGQFFLNGRNYRAPRVSAYLAGMTGLNCRCPKMDNVLHDPEKCNNPVCVNPRHLRVGTRQDNERDKKIAGTFVAPPRTDTTGRRKHKDKISQIKTLRAQGMSLRKISKATDVPYTTVQSYLSQ